MCAKDEAMCTEDAAMCANEATMCAEHATVRASSTATSDAGGGAKRRGTAQRTKSPARPLPSDAPVAKLEARLGDLLEASVGRGEAVGLESFSTGPTSRASLQADAPPKAEPLREIDARALGFHDAT